MDLQLLHILYIILVVGVGLTAGPAVARFAARRISKQPVAFSTEAERNLVAGVLSQPHLYPAVAELEADMFVDDEARSCWEHIKTLVKDANNGEDVTAESEKELRRKRDLVPADLAEKVQTLHGTTLTLETHKTPPTLKTLLGYGEEILYGHKDRITYSGKSVFHKGEEGEPALVRRYQAPSKLNIWATRALLGGMLALIPTFAFLWSTSLVATILAGASLLALVLMGVVIALVDNDTLYIDLPVFYLGVGASWALALGATIADGEPSKALAGLIVVAIAVFFRVVNFVYTRIRKRDGMGFGDSLIIVATCGVPAILSGDPILGLYAMLGGCIAGIAHWVLLRLFGGATAETPFAFGPGLVVGWIFAVPLLLLMDSYSRVIG